MNVAKRVTGIFQKNDSVLSDFFAGWLYGNYCDGQDHNLYVYLTDDSLVIHEGNIVLSDESPLTLVMHINGVCTRDKDIDLTEAYHAEIDFMARCQAELCEILSQPEVCCC
jgi:hypothetical protein